MIKIMIVDDHPFIRLGLSDRINQEKDMQVIAEANDGLQALQKLLTLEVDLILLDMSMPHLSGKALVQAIVKQNHAVKILILSAYSDDQYVSGATKNGAHGYLLKSTSPQELIQAIRDIYLGHIIIPKDLLPKLINNIREPDFPKEPNLYAISKKEQSVLKLTAKGLTNKQISTELNISEGTVRSHISHILRKLDFSSRSQLILFGVKEGLVDPEQLIH